MSAVNRIAANAWPLIHPHGLPWRDLAPLFQDSMRQTVRAVLTAAREAGDPALRAGGTTVQQRIDREGMFVNGIARDVWRAMVDTILAEPQ